jgi:hypothetical protein
MPFGAITFKAPLLPPAYSACLKQQIAKTKAGGGDPSICAPLLQGGAPRSGASGGGIMSGSFAGIPTWGWVAGGAVLAGGIWYFMIRKPAAAG